MKILILSQFFSNTRGGGEYLLSLIAKKLAENNHQVWVLTNKIEDEEYDFQKNIKLVFIPPTLKYKGGLPPGFSDNARYLINAVISGLKIIKKEKIDIIHSNNFAPALAGSVLSGLTSKPHITSIWDIFTLCGKDYWKRWTAQHGVSKIHEFLGPRFEKFILKLPHKAIHTISDVSKEDLIKFGAKKPIYEIPPSILYDETINENTNHLQFIFIGRLIFYKNLEVVIKAIKIIKKTDEKIKLIIIGGGPHKNELEDLVKKLGIERNVEFKGYVNTEEKNKLIAESCALVFPSLCEGFGLVILEAFAQKKPVLVSNIRPMSDIVFDKKMGFVLDPYNEKVWAEKMMEVSKNPDLAMKMGLDGWKTLEKNYNSQAMYEKIVKMYYDII